MTTTGDIAKELSTIASYLRKGSEATLQARYHTARTTYLDNTVDRIAEFLETDDYSVRLSKRSGRRILTVESTKQLGMFLTPEAKIPFTLTLKWDGEEIAWEQDKAGHEVASSQEPALKNTPTACAKKVTDGLVFN